MRIQILTLNLNKLLYKGLIIIKLIKMNVQKSSTKRISLNKVDTFTKNKIIDSLIKNKLIEEKPKIKQNLNKITNREQAQIQSYQKSFQIKKRRSLSVKSISTSMSKIRQSLAFDPLSQVQKIMSEQLNFIISRQRSSPLVDQAQIQMNADSRQNFRSLQVKFSKSDRLTYSQAKIKTVSQQSSVNSNKQQIQKYLKEIEIKAKQSIDQNLWISHEPYAQGVFQQLNEDKDAFDKIYFTQAPKFKSSNFTAKYQSDGPLKSNKNKKYQTKHQITYDHKKYHKEDYQSLQLWFQKHLKSIKDNITPQNYKQNFNNVYTLYICSFQQIVRLTYIQSYQKGIFLQKVLWSFIRLFSRLMQVQHKINYADFQYFNSQNKQMRIMYQDRCTKLQKMMFIAQAEAKQTIQIRSKLSKAYLTYSRVNRVLSQQLQQKSQQLRNIEGQNNLIKHKLMKMIGVLQQKQFIKIIVDQLYTSYYYFNQNKAQVLIQIPNVQKKKSSIVTVSPQNQQFQKNQDSNIAKKIRRVENQLNKYWVKKEEDLVIRNLINNQLMNYQYKSIQTQTDVIQSESYSVQFPEESQSKSFAQYLAHQLQDQRQNFEKEMQNQNDLYISLKELYQESYQKIETLRQKNKKLYFELQKTKLTIQKLEKQNALNFKQNNQLSQKLKLSQKTISQRDLQLKQTNIKIERLENQFSQTNNKYKVQLQNSKNLVRNNIQQKQKLNIAEQKVKQVQQKQNKLDENIKRLEIIQKQFLAIDKRLKKLSPTLQTFLQYQKFDNDSIIKKTKEDIEMLLDKYVCKDSALFLTKAD